jgi:hypothetical protein
MHQENNKGNRLGGLMSNDEGNDNAFNRSNAGRYRSKASLFLR